MNTSLPINKPRPRIGFRGFLALTACAVLLCGVPTHGWAKFAPTKPAKAVVRPVKPALAKAKPVLAKAKPAPAHWIPLFNGKNLQGWTPKIKGYDLGVNFGNTFRVENGVLKVAYDAYPQFNDRFGHLFYKTPYSNYRIRAEYRFTGDQCPGGPGWAFRNSGIMIHCQPPQTMRKDQDFPVSVEVQLLGGNGKDERHTANMCSPGTNIVLNGKLFTTHCTDSTSPTFHGDGWVTVEVEVHGNGLVRHMVNGKTVLEYEQPQLDENDADAQKLIKNGDKMLRGGYISLQSESHPVEFRKVELLPLSR